MPVPMHPSLPGSLGAAGVLLLGLIIFSGWAAARGLGAMIAAGPAGGAVRRAAAGIAIAAFGVRLVLANGRVSWAPYYDQWYSVIGGLVAPLAHGKLAWAQLTAPNNEHRIVLTRAVDLGSVLLNGEWDNRVPVIVMFLLQAIAAGWACAVAWSILGWLRGTAVAFAVLLPAVLVCDWENLVSGFQTQFGFLVLGSVVACSLLAPGARRPVVTAGLLAICALLLGSMASGLVTALVVGTGAVLGWRSSGRAAPFPAALVAGTAVLLVAGWMIRPSFALVELRAHGTADFLRALLAYGAWPLAPHLAALIFLWAPWTVLAVKVAAGRPAPAGWAFPFTLGLWVILQAAALAWSRAGLSGLVSSRYTEVLAWALVANAFAFALLLAPSAPGAWMRVARAGFPVWLLVIAGCEITRSQEIYRPYLESFRGQTREHEERLGAFARTGDAGPLTEVAFPRIPAPPEVLLPLLRDPSVRSLLAAPLRRQFPSQPGLAIEAGPLSFLAVRALHGGGWFVGAGCLLALSAALSGRSRNPAR